MTVGVVLVGFQIVFAKRPLEIWESVKSQPVYWFLAAYYLLPFIALTHTAYLSDLLKQQQTLLPLLVTPLGLLAGSFYQPRQQRLMADNLILVVFITGLLTFIFYLLNYQAMNEKLSQSQDIPIFTGVNHIYFSIIAAFAACLGSIRLYHQRLITPAWWWALAVMTIGNVLFLHIFTTRTGLGGFYLGMGLVLFLTAIRYRCYGLAFGSVGMLAVVAVMAVWLLPPLQRQYQETVEDVNVYLNDENPNYYSLTTRFKAWETCWYVVKQHPVLGTGPGTFPKAMDSAYEEQGTLLLHKNRIGPHNQYLQALAQSGIPGIAALLAALGWPCYLMVRRRYSATGVALLAIVSFAFLAEAVLERQTGVTFISFFLPLIFYQVQQGQSAPVFDEPEPLDSP